MSNQMILQLRVIFDKSVLQWENLIIVHRFISKKHF